MERSNFNHGRSSQSSHSQGSKRPRGSESHPMQQVSAVTHPQKFYKRNMTINPWEGLKPISIMVRDRGKQPPAFDITRAIREQAEYYFSPSNLQNDQYLMPQMVSRGSKGEGWVDLETVNNFNRMQKFQLSIQELARILIRNSSKLEVQEEDQQEEEKSLKWWVRSREASTS